MRLEKERNRVVLNEGTEPVSSFSDGGNKKGTGPRTQDREAGVWRSVALTETGCQEEPLLHPSTLLHLPRD